MGIWGRSTVRGLTNRGTRAELFLLPGGGENRVDFIASLDCRTSPEREHTVAIFLRRLGTNTTDWDLPHETTFGRYHPIDGFGQGSRQNRVNGVYREICVPQLGHSSERWNLRAYNQEGAHILIHYSGNSYSVYPADCWEPQTAVFTLQYNNTGTIGAVVIPSDDCTYLVYFGSYLTPSGLWVKADVKASSRESIDEDIWKSYHFTGEDTSISEIIHRAGMGLPAKKAAATAKLTIVWEVLNYEIRIVLSRLSPRRIIMHERDDDTRSSVSV
jgi:hypothetical protein